jgi:hypothetical protein
LILKDKNPILTPGIQRKPIRGVPEDGSPADAMRVITTQGLRGAMWGFRFEMNESDDLFINIFYNLYRD